MGGSGWTLYLFSSTNELTPRESTLLGIILTICSTLVGWIVTHIYSAAQTQAAIDDVVERSQANLRMYALKAAEKVNNLSNQLSNLAAYLEQELAEDEEPDARQALFAREERMFSAIHLLKSLKASNDTSLSDWEGVIGDELSQQREERLEKEELLRSLVDRVESLSEEQTDTEALRSEGEQLRRDLRLAIASLSNNPPLSPKPTRISTKSKKIEVQGECPKCGGSLKYRQRPSANSTKTVPCSHCGTSLFSKWDATNGFVLKEVIPVDVEVICPNCSVDALYPLSPLTGATSSLDCPCGAKLTLSRLSTGDVRVRMIPPSESSLKAVPKLDEALLESVRSLLPPQPWPSGTAKEVAKKLCVTPTVIDRALRELTNRGVVMAQIDGRLYQPVAAPE